ncbi:MAG: hypothetical protein H6R01_908 [Burkholderiaceae bacterium]|nr:hypothetical protein [Burkholderiaceae bacterium]
MSGNNLRSVQINNGNASRYIKPKWINCGNLSTAAFDLRVGPPPESYVSHFMTEGVGIQRFTFAYEIISKKIEKCHVGSIALLDVSEALAEVNDGDAPFIKFEEKGLPHCGLIYLTEDQAQIQEAKATLSIIAQRNMMPAADIATAFSGTKRIS